MKLWHWKSHWKSRVTLKNLGTKKWVTLKIFQCDLKFFSVISLSLNNKGKYFSEIILDYLCYFLWKYFSVWFLYLFSVTKKFQCDFQCHSVYLRRASIVGNIHLCLYTIGNLWSVCKSGKVLIWGGTFIRENTVASIPLFQRLADFWSFWRMISSLALS